MKILFLTTHLNVGGISTYVVTLAKQLKEKGIEVVCASSGGLFVTELQQVGIKHYTVPVNTKNELHIKLALSFFKILEIINKEEITHIHAHTRVTQVLSCYLKKVKKIYVVTTCHGFYKKRLFRRLFPAWGDKVIAISDPVREHLVNDFKIHKTKIALVYNGVNLEKFNCSLTDTDKHELRRYFKVKPEGLLIGGISRLEKVKGYQNLIRAMPAILKEYPTTQCLLIGQGKYQKKLMKLARSLSVEKNVIFAGKIDNVNMILEIIDIFILPAVWREGFGLAVLEAMAAGKPIITSNVGGVYALVKEGVNGWLLSPGDIDAISKTIIQFIENPSLVTELGNNSRQLAHEKFSIEQMVQNVITVYSELENE